MTWLMRRLGDQANVQVTQPTLYAYLGGYCHVRREWVEKACLIAGANIGDVLTCVAGQESVLFQPDKR